MTTHSVGGNRTIEYDCNRIIFNCPVTLPNQLLLPADLTFSNPVSNAPTLVGVQLGTSATNPQDAVVSINASNVGATSSVLDMGSVGNDYNFRIISHNDTGQTDVWSNGGTLCTSYLADASSTFQVATRLALANGNGVGFDNSGYETVDTTATGIWAAAQNITFRFQRWGKQVSISWTSIAPAAANAASFITITAAIPVNYRPAATIYLNPLIQDNSVDSWGLMKITSAGVITIHVGAGTNFTNANNAALYASGDTYVL